MKGGLAFKRMEFGLRVENEILRILGINATTRGLYFYAPFRADGLHLSLHFDGIAHIKKGNGELLNRGRWIRIINTIPKADDIRKKIGQLLIKSGFIHEPEGRDVLVMVIDKELMFSIVLNMLKLNMLKIQSRSLKMYIDLGEKLARLVKYIIENSRLFIVDDHSLFTLLRDFQNDKVLMMSSDLLISGVDPRIPGLIGVRRDDSQAFRRLLSTMQQIEHFYGLNIVKFIRAFIEEAVKDMRMI